MASLPPLYEREIEQLLADLEPAGADLRDFLLLPWGPVIFGIGLVLIALTNCRRKRIV